MDELIRRPLPPPPYNTPYLEKSGLLSVAWQRWVNETYVRMGGKDALSNAQLEALIIDLSTQFDVLRARVTDLETP